MNDNHWLKETLTDSQGFWDVGNIGLFVLLGMVFATVTYILTMATIAAFFPMVEFSGEMAKDIGIAVGSICGGFATALFALGAYKWGDSKRPPMTTTVTEATATVQTTLQPATVTPPITAGTTL